MSLIFVDTRVNIKKQGETYYVPGLFNKEYTKKDLNKEVEYELEIDRYSSGRREMIIQVDGVFILREKTFSATDIYNMEDRFVKLMDKLKGQVYENTNKGLGYRVYIEKKKGKIVMHKILKLIEEFNCYKQKKDE